MSFGASHEGVFLRVKRKREDEPATHMLAEIALPGAKKMRESFVPGVFTYAETVEDSSVFQDKMWVDNLNKRVNTLSRAQMSPPLSTASYAEGPMSISTTPQTTTTELSSVRRASVSSPTKAAARSYTIVPQKPEQTAPPPPRTVSRPKAPPVVRSANAPPPTLPNVTFYEAIESTSGGTDEDELLTDSTMAQFASMVDDYLKLNNIALDEPRAVTSTSSPSSRTEVVSPTEAKSLTSVTGGTEDYVYDVFFFALKDVNDINELMENEAAHIATLRGLPLENFEELIPEEGSDDSTRDEADEDSNDEDWYGNDYPDEDVADSDEDERRVERGWTHYRYEDDF